MNIVTIKKFKAHKKTQLAQQELSGYLDVLSFNELISEATAAISELKKRPVNSELTIRSKTIVSHFIKRLQIDSPEMANFLISEQVQENGFIGALL